MGEGKAHVLHPVLSFDHVMIPVADLDAAAAGLKERHGLGSVPGGAHPGWGTANRIVPLGAGYIELISATDPELHPLGRLIAERAQAGGPVGWCLAADNLDALASRLSLPIVAGRRELPDGGLLTWRLAGIEDAIADPSLPFFISWDGPSEDHPGRAEADHGIEPLGIAWLEVGGDETNIRRRIGDEPLDLRFSGGEGVRAVGIATSAGEIVLSPSG